MVNPSKPVSLRKSRRSMQKQPLTADNMEKWITIFTSVLLFTFDANCAFSRQCFIPHYRVFATADPGFINVNGNQYTGFAIDVLTRLSILQNFTYDVTLGGDSNFGTQPKADGNGNPCFPGNSGVGALQSGAYDIFAGNVIVSYERAKSIDFTVPLLRQTYQVGYKVDYPDYGTYRTASSYGNTYTYSYTAKPVKYVTIANGATRDFLEQSKIPRIQAIWANIQAHRPASLPATFAQAIVMVKQGGWAIFTTGPKLDQQVCSSYGIIAKDPTVYAVVYAAFGVQKGSSILNMLNEGILQLEENNVIDNLLYRWFPCTNFSCN